MKLLHKLVAAFNYIIGSFAFLAGFLIFFAMVIVFVGIVARNVGHPIGWVIEICQFILVYFTFLAAAWILKEEEHVKIDLILSRLQPKTQSLVVVITSLISAVVCSVLAWYGFKATWGLYQTNYLTVSVLQPAPPLYIFIAVIPVGLLVLAIQLLRGVYAHLKQLRTLPQSETR